MTVQEFALRMWPAWTLGLLMLFLVKNSKYSFMLRVDKKGLLKFCCFLTFITAFRFVMFRYFTPAGELSSAKEMANFLPWQVTFGVFWEDMCHTVPLAILGKMFAKEMWYKIARIPLLILVMFAFGSGHVYQGLFAAFALSFYIPYTLKMGKKYGFGTVMICHMAYDLTTLLSLKWMLG
jgi:hypothetical protein